MEHSGGMQGGHYTAYVRTRLPIKYDVNHTTSRRSLSEERSGVSEVAESEEHGGACGEEVRKDRREFDLSSKRGQWYFISDSRVRTATENEVVKSQAYLLFYERLPLLSQPPAASSSSS